VQAYRVIEWERPAELVDIPVPSPGPGQVLVKVAGNGLCHSDLAMQQVPESIGDALGWHVPFTLGHEIAGQVAAVGDGVRAVGEGDPVALLSPASCGTCRACRRGHESACPHGAVGRGYGRDGGLAGYVLVERERDCLALGTLDPAEAGPLTDAGATSHHAVARVAPHLAEDASAVVIGAGGLGAFAVQILRALTPARVVAIDVNAGRRELAAELGAHDVLAGVDDDTASHVRALLEGVGADAVLDFVGTDATIRAGLACVEPGGAFGLVGAGGGTFRGPWFGGLPQDVEVFTFERSDVADARAVIELVADGRVRNVVDRFQLSRVADAYAALEAGALRGRAVVAPD
jgi:propanol-preferring alcohol dehydrogenase